MKMRDARHDITVFERNARGSTFGWGVVLSDQVLQKLHAADPKTARQISDTLAHWDDIDVHFKGRMIRSSGHGFCGISREKLLEIQIQRALELGVKIEFQKEVDPSDFPQADLIVASDGLFSKTRLKYQEIFKPDIELRKNRFIWMGTKKVFPAFTFIFEKTEFGWIQAHCYRFEKDLSTFIVECPEEVWLKAGIDKMQKEEGVQFCEKLFAPYLSGEKLMTKSDHLRGSAAWICFQRVKNENWFHKNIVLLGDASGTAHFSIGSGTRLAFEGAITLAQQLSSKSDLKAALSSYQEIQGLELLKLQNAARNSCEWFESVELKAKLEPEQFNYSLLTRSQRVSHEELRIRDKKYLEGFESWFEKRALGTEASSCKPPMFVPFSLRGLKLKNRVAVSPMAMYSAIAGVPGDFHLVHLGSLCLGGAGLIFTEMTNVSAEGRISPGCAGIYNEEQMLAWKRIVKFVHENSASKIALQLGHSGPKGSTQLGWQESDQPLSEGNWEIIAPSAKAFGPANQVPREMNQADFTKVRNDFLACAKRGLEAGFDMLELHCAHGYLLSSFISPLTNQRKDQYGGSLENRARFPLEIFAALRQLWPQEKPISVRISATDWVEGGISIDHSVKIAAMFKEAGADIIDVSAGQVSRDQKPVYGRLFQTPFADRIRSEVNIATMAVGNIYEADQVNSIIAAGRADMCLMARPHLADPHWTLRAAAELGFKEQLWPNQYLSAKRQLETNLGRAKAEILALRSAQKFNQAEND